MELLIRMGMKKDMLKGEVAVVTGAARGIGEATARDLAWLGAKVVIADISESGSDVARTINDSGGEAVFIKTDVSKEESIKNLVSETNRLFGKIDIQVNSAARLKVGPVLDVDIEYWDEGYFTNFRGPVLNIKNILPGMMERKHGVIITMITLEGLPFMAGYSANKMGLKSLMISLGREIGPELGVSIFAVVPGAVDTPLIHEMAGTLSQYFGKTPEEVMASLANNPGYEGLVPVEHSAASLAYMIVNAPQYHGQFIDGFLPLSQTGIIQINQGNNTSVTNEEFAFEKLPNPEVELKQLLTINRNLENRIEERTRQLQEMAQTLKEKNENIMDSINYARFIQLSILPREEKLKQSMKEHFVMWKPRDIVGGDIYWFEQYGDNYLIAVIDCTGHGVPGAFMTMTANSVLNRVTGEICHDNPARILNELNKIVRTTLNHNVTPSEETGSLTSLSDDGMDVGLCYVMPEKNKLVYAGAKIPLFSCKNGEVTVIKADSQSIGYKKSKDDYDYTNHEIQLDGDEVFFLTSDGYIDQDGEENDMTLGRKNFKEILIQNYTRPLTEQKEVLEESLKKYQGNKNQRDDITVIGFRV